MQVTETKFRSRSTVLRGTSSVARFCADVRALTREQADWQVVVDDLVARFADRGLPSAEDVLSAVPAEARNGSQRSVTLHVEPDGSFSVVALVSRPGQATSIHDHTTWCVVAVVAGTEREERFDLDLSGQTLLRGGTRTDERGAVSGFTPPGDIHRVTNPGDSLAVSLHVYGTDIARIGSSVRRTYDLPVLDPNTSDQTTPRSTI